jgi:hypothetical protein
MLMVTAIRVLAPGHAQCSSNNQQVGSRVWAGKAGEFDDWDQKPTAEKIWTNFKTFTQEAYTRRLNATSITTGAQGYTQNAFTVLQESDDYDDDIQLFVTQMAGLMT